MGADVHGISRKIPINNESGLLLWGIADKISNHIGDVADQTFVKQVIEESSPHWIFHLAAQSIVSKGQTTPRTTFETNVHGTLNIISHSQISQNLSGIIVASSDKAYGNSLELPYVEDAPLRGGSIYDTSKACADLLANSYSTWLKIPLCITRCANIYGPGDLNFSRIVPDVLRELIAGRAPVIRGHGRHERDFVYIDDVVSGYLKIAQYLSENKVSGEPFNLGTGISTNIYDLVTMISKIYKSGEVTPLILGEEKPEEITKQYVNWEKAKAKLDWEPEFTLHEGLKATIDWYSNYLINRIRTYG